MEAAGFGGAFCFWRLPMYGTGIRYLSVFASAVLGRRRWRTRAGILQKQVFQSLESVVFYFFDFVCLILELGMGIPYLTVRVLTLVRVLTPVSK